MNISSKELENFATSFVNFLGHLHEQALLSEQEPKEEYEGLIPTFRICLITSREGSGDVYHSGTDSINPEETLRKFSETIWPLIGTRNKKGPLAGILAFGETLKIHIKRDDKT